MSVPQQEMTEERLLEMLGDGRQDDIRSSLARMDPADVADLLEEVGSDNVEKVFAVLDPEHASDVLVEMDPKDAEEVAERLPPDRMAAMISEMAPDDAADFLKGLDIEDLTEVRQRLSEEDRTRIDELLDYHEDSGGGLMTSEICALTEDSSVQDAINVIAGSDFSDPVMMVFVIDANRRLVGSIGVSELLAKKRWQKLADVMDPDPVFATVNQDQEEIARSFRKYDLHVMPVIDEERRLVGRITVDDVMDVFHEEASEDLARFAGAPDIESNELAPLAIVRLRLPWLLITMFTGLVISVIIQRMTGLTSIEGLAAFVPVIMAMGGNTGMQASAVTVRSIALGEIRFDELFSVFGREIRVGIMMGIACGLVTAVVVWFNLNFFHAPMTISTLRLSSIVALSMCMAMTFASFAGTLLPILLHRLKIDPAVASGPFVTTGNDLSASLIYFAMCYFLLRL